MFIVILITLILIIFSVLEHSFILTAITGGLLWIVWYLHSKLNTVDKKIKNLESIIVNLKAAQPSPQEEDWQTKSNESTPFAKSTTDDKQTSTPSKPNIIDDNGVDVDLGITETSPAYQKAELDDSLNIYSDSPTNTTSLNAVSDQSLHMNIGGVAVTTQNSEPQTNDNQNNKTAEQLSEDATQSAASSQSPEHQGPTIVEKLFSACWNWVTDGNVFVRVGIIVLFMGMTFLTRYAIGQNLIPIELRLAAISTVALGLLFWGWKQREVKPSFSLVVQGGGIGLLYLTIFASFNLYNVIPPTLAFTLLALVVVLAAIIAIAQDAKPLALFATIGGFLAPVLTSSGSNNYIGLFGYYALLNLGIFSVAWFKSWRILNFTGFIFTFLISTVWGVLSYQKEFFNTTEPFLILFFLLYVSIGILFAHKRTPFYKNYVDSSLVFGTPIFAFGLQCAMVKDYEYGVAISAVALGIFYLILASALWKKFGNRLRLLTETFLSLGVIFTTLAIPFAIDGYLSGAAWAIEGAGILWVSIKQEQKYRRYFAIALIFAAGPMMIYGLQAVETTTTVSPFINSFFIGCVIITVAATLASWLLSRDFVGKESIENTISTALLLYSVVALLGGFEIEIFDFQLLTLHGSLLALLSGVAMLFYTTLATKLAWSKASWVSVGFVLPLSISAALSFSHQTQLSDYFGYLLWPSVFIICFYGFKKSVKAINDKLLLLAHILAAICIAGLLIWDGIWQLMLGYSVLAMLFNHLSKRFEWPQLKLLALGFLPVLVLCSILAITLDGDLTTLSNISGNFRPPFPPGFLLWPLSFAIYFYLIYHNKALGGNKNPYFHYAGAALIGLLLLWLGLKPLLLGASLLAVLFCTLWQKLDWAEMRIISMALLPVMLLTAAMTFLAGNFHLATLDGLSSLTHTNFNTHIEAGFYLWPLSFITLFWTFWRYDKLEQSPPTLFHPAGIVLLSFVLTWEVSWHLLDHFDLLNAWHMAWVPLISMLMIVVILRAKSWPFSKHNTSYQNYALPLLALVLVMWLFLQIFSSGNSAPLPWIPIVNPLDIVQITILIGAFFLKPKLTPQILKRVTARQVFYGVVGFGFIWGNTELLRSVHHWSNIPWQLPDIISAHISQTIISLFWALSGLLVTIFASKRHDRTLWFFGGALLIAVVLKLFVIDLSAQGTIERIISFTGVGLLLVAVGYFSPLPPKGKSDKSPVKEVLHEEGETDV